MNSSLYETPLKKLKNEPEGSGAQEDPLSFTENCKMYTRYRSGNSVSTIAKESGTEYHKLRRQLKKAEEDKTFESRHANCGRKKKLDERHKKLLKGYVERNEVHSVNQAWQRLNSVENVKRVSYRLVSDYLKALGDFVTPLLKTKISEVNMKKRVDYAKEYLNFDYSRTLFTDESRFELNTNTLKVFQRKGAPRPLKTKFNPNFSVMAWGELVP